MNKMNLQGHTSTSVGGGANDTSTGYQRLIDSRVSMENDDVYDLVQNKNSQFNKDYSAPNIPGGLRMTLTGPATSHFYRTSFLSLILNENPNEAMPANNTVVKIREELKKIGSKESQHFLAIQEEEAKRKDSTTQHDEYENSDKMVATEFMEEQKVNTSSPGLDKEMRILQKALEDNNAVLFIQLRLKPEEVVTMLFKHKMNILQAACYFSADSIVRYLKDLFKNSPQEVLSQLTQYKEPFGGNTAMHFAVLKGNKKIIDVLMNDFHLSPIELTSNGLSIFHCAAQYDRGTLAIEMFLEDKNVKLSVDERDSFDCTPLHFAVLNQQIKCVECLLARGADVNAKNGDGQTPLHIAILKYVQQATDDFEQLLKHYQFIILISYSKQLEPDPSEFEEFKRILKELLFNGAERKEKGNFTLSGINARLSSQIQQLTPLELLQNFEDVISPREYGVIRSFLLGASETICFQTRRPLQKVKRNNKFMLIVLGLNLINIILNCIQTWKVLSVQYCSTGICPGAAQQTDDIMIFPLKGIELINLVCMVIAVITYLITNMLNPGYIYKKLNFIEILQIGNDRNIDLENFCFYCQLIKSTRTFHCMVCQRCVEKFDHHCVYINNCLGYRNHKYFMIFIANITLYIILSTVSRILAFFTIELNDIGKEDTEYSWKIFMIISLGYTLVVNLLISIPLGFQLKEQIKRLRKVEEIERDYDEMMNLDQHTDFSYVNTNRKTTDKSSKSNMIYSLYQNEFRKLQGSFRVSSASALKHGKENNTQEPKTYIEKRGGLCYNIKELFTYRPASQEKLRDFLFSDSERLSVFLNKKEDFVAKLSIRKTTVKSTRETEIKKKFTFGDPLAAPKPSNTGDFPIVSQSVARQGSNGGGGAIDKNENRRLFQSIQHQSVDQE